MTEIDTLLGQVMPAGEAAVGAYGVGVLTRTEDEAAGATVRLGQRLPARILHRGTDAVSVEVGVTDLAGRGEDPDVRAALRRQIKRALRDDPQFADELSAMLPERPAPQATGARSVSVTDNTGIISVGDGATNIQYL
ncbi:MULTISPECIES: hypothetical protein [unclassified Streptomyces]|uniref:hypothetical protein n=1 Tax=unclassified Streptomyces TaxID=2593676 RepID=UPI00039D91D4|nr:MULTISPECIES: hypothetical protein [unclassified Streptomyces]MYT34350.1 hypothetical protein [Streptomyces sp. SID8354]